MYESDFCNLSGHYKDWLSVFAGTALTRLVLPERVKEIGGEAFQDCHQLTSVQFDKGLLYIKDHAFKNSGLASLELPEA